MSIKSKEQKIKVFTPLFVYFIYFEFSYSKPKEHLQDALHFVPKLRLETKRNMYYNLIWKCSKRKKRSDFNAETSKNAWEYKFSGM